MLEMSAEPVLRTRDLAKHYGAVRALDDLSLALGGGTVGLLGPNGAGKTTLIQILLGLVRPDRGGLSVLGHDPTRPAGRTALRAAIGYMPEGDCLIPGRNAVETCTDLARLSGLRLADARSRAHEVLDYVGLEEERYRPTEQYSTGMKQRLKLAQALVHDPRLLLLDEPTNGLDPRGRRHMLDLVRDLGRDQHKDVILCSHLLPDVERTCTSVAVLHRGRVAAHGAIADMTRDEGHVVRVEADDDGGRFEAALIAAGYAVEREVTGLLRVALPEVAPDAEGVVDDLFRVAAGTGARLRAVARVRSTLEDVFLRAVEGGAL